MIWLLFAFIQMVSLPLTIFGLVILAPMSWFELWTVRDSFVFPGREITVWRGGIFTWIWGNEEDGVIGKEWGKPRPYYWSAIRNPVNNLRFVPGVSKVGRPLIQKYFSVGSHQLYLQFGWNDRGWPVLSAGKP